MNLLYNIFKKYTPSFIKRRELKELAYRASLAFDKEMPSFTGKSFNECLILFALFTKNSVEQLIKDDIDLESVKQDLFVQAYDYGKKIRKKFNVSSSEEAIGIFILLYKLIGIEVESYNHSELIIGKCYFSRFYTSGICKVMSALDEGVFEGISDGSRLTFEQRITEGCSCGKAGIY